MWHSLPGLPINAAHVLLLWNFKLGKDLSCGDIFLLHFSGALFCSHRVSRWYFSDGLLTKLGHWSIWNKRLYDWFAHFWTDNYTIHVRRELFLWKHWEINVSKTKMQHFCLKSYLRPSRNVLDIILLSTGTRCTLCAGQWRIQLADKGSQMNRCFTLPSSSSITLLSFASCC